MSDTGNDPQIPRGQGYGPPPKAPPHPQDPPRQGYPGYGPQGASPYPPAPGPVAAPYGAPPPGYPPYQVQPSKPMSGKAIASLVCGLVSVFMWPLAVVGGPAALALGWMSMKETGPHGDKGGRGLAIGGMIAGSLMFLVALAIGGVLIFAFTFAERQQSRIEAELATERQRYADSDLRLIRDRLNLYYIENNRSLKPGGPIVVDGWEGGLFDENSPRVTGKLELKHLVREDDLVQQMREYELVIEGDSKAKIRNRDKGRELVIEDAGSDRYVIRDIGN